MTLTQYGPDCASAKAKGTCEAHPEYARVYCPVTCGMCPGEETVMESDDVFAFDFDLAADMIDEVKGLFAEELNDAECVDKPFPLDWQKYVRDCADAKAKGNCNRAGGYIPYAKAYCPKTCGYCSATCADQPIPPTLTQYGPDCASAKANGNCEAHPEYARVYC